ncbi:uncharacterized protein BP01DRAFT_405226 [Aspergillus saccharolyticus JOP 1030-1]|uniref:DUF1349-domain-containing protein n=1 Tax=Aspergillus saccharolyticus JOP 1030-1 TaxID=1450539 RepID=A0A318ZQ63_9EURO|nr:hypothetical protein BP01DRAFT_405226 [Aspergillus saccharolyticus JOP 1030-1]PYH42258.1 hypothetical protein BP01DRAFT_405226 [Aspergillus saccharolyticus JOP 1030-1]
MAPWHITNATTPLPSPDTLSSAFSLRAPPGTDLWDSPPDTCIFTAPLVYQAMPLAAFKRAQVTITGDLHAPYAQAGLALVWGGSDGRRRWVKTGMECLAGRQVVATVGKDRWPDCSVGGVVPRVEASKQVTLEVVRQGFSLEIFQLHRTQHGEWQRTILRELTWVFAAQGGEREGCWAGVYVANPSSEAPEFEVRFEGLVLEQTENN